jgi:transketolase
VARKNENKLKVIAKRVRVKILQLVYHAHSPHIGPSFSCVEILVSLYFKILNIPPKKRGDANRDRFIFSKGHACPALYAILQKRGFISKKDLDNYGKNGSVLEHHPTMDFKRGIEISTGSLGHGLSVAVGMALAAKRDRKRHKVYVLLSDGELNEGSTWEAVLFAAHHKLDNLVVIVDYNKMQALGFTKDIIKLDPLAKKWASFNWEAKEIDGHNFNDIFKVFRRLPFKQGKPSAIIAHTVKGKGVSFMENSLLWHYRPPDDNEYKRAMQELSR